ncbi:MAG: hypothetical protein NXI32_08335 [bacterium]|nr:hypothetical protein [bacterium]
MIFNGEQMVTECQGLGITHIVWVPDSVIGKWEQSFVASSLHLLRVCREGEAWPLAAGLITGGQRPLVMMQSTGFFESGDALRNVVYDLKLPVFAIVGARNWFQQQGLDSARDFCLPMLQAWDLDYCIIETESERSLLSQHYVHCQSAGKAGVVLLGE